jgi:hypothetical protein
VVLGRQCCIMNTSYIVYVNVYVGIRTYFVVVPHLIFTAKLHGQNSLPSLPFPPVLLRNDIGVEYPPQSSGDRSAVHVSPALHVIDGNPVRQPLLKSYPSRRLSILISGRAPVWLQCLSPGCHIMNILRSAGELAVSLCFYICQDKQ